MSNKLRLTESEFKRLNLAGKGIKTQEIAQSGKKLPQNRGKGHSAAGLEHIKQVLRKRGLIFIEEFRFHPTRKFRFDLCLPAYGLYIEYDGLMSKKSRHTTITGFSKDQTKFNLAAANGWTGFRYSVLNYKDFEPNLIEFLMKRK